MYEHRQLDIRMPALIMRFGGWQ